MNDHKGMLKKAEMICCTNDANRLNTGFSCRKLGAGRVHPSWQAELNEEEMEKWISARNGSKERSRA
jgi:hypothetical protein